jgi:conjugative transfer signal peptidase TraF
MSQRFVTAIVASALTVTVAAPSVARAIGLRYNATNSTAIGFWLERRFDASTPYLFACPEASRPAIATAVNRGFLPAGDCPSGLAPLLKRIVARPTDTVALWQSGVLVNGVAESDAAVLAADSVGRPLPHVPFGFYHLASDQYWVMGDHSPASLDSRYFGPVTGNEIMASAEPVLTWEWR